MKVETLTLTFKVIDLNKFDLAIQYFSLVCMTESPSIHKACILAKVWLLLFKIDVRQRKISRSLQSLTVTNFQHVLFFKILQCSADSNLVYIIYCR